MVYAEAVYAEATKFRHCILPTHSLTGWMPQRGLALMRSVPDSERLVA